MSSIVRPLSPTQSALVTDQLLAPGAPHLNIAWCYGIDGDIDRAVLAQALHAAACNCDALRAVLRNDGGNIVQEFLTTAEVSWECAECDAAAAALSWGTERVRRQYELFDSLLYRFVLAGAGKARSYLFVAGHHVMSDGWGLQVVARRVCEAYNDILCGRDPIRGVPQFQDVVLEDCEYLGSPGYQRDASFWQSRMSPPPPPLLRERAGVAAPAMGYPAEHYTLQLDPRLVRGLCEQSKACAVSTSHALTAIVAGLLASRFGTDDLVIATSVLAGSPRTRREVVGVLAGVALIRVRNIRGRPLDDLFRSVSAEARQVYRHHRYPFREAARCLGRPFALERFRVFPATLSIFRHEETQMMLGGARMGSPLLRILNGYEASPIQLSIGDPERAHAVNLDLCCNTAWFEPGAARDLAEEFVTFLESAVESSAFPVRQVPMQSAAGRTHLHLPGTPGSDWQLPGELAHRLVLRHGTTQPDAVALTDARQTLSYRTLSERVNQLAAYLRSHGVGPEHIVGVCMGRSAESVIAFVAILEAGGAYLPLDRHWPAQRLQYVLQDAQPVLVLSDRESCDAVRAAGAEPVCIDSEWELIQRGPADRQPSVVSPENLAYVIYTSGTTGKPKGTLLTHFGLANLARALRDRRFAGPGTRVLQFANHCFDASIAEMMIALAAGGTLVLDETRALYPGPELARTLAQQAIGFVILPPSVLELLHEYPLPRLQAVMSAGEALPDGVASEWAGRCQLFNGYGPTEITVCSNIARCGTSTGPVVIGEPIANTQVYVLDEQMEPVAVGVGGELYIEGAGLARGYLKQPGLTAQRFVANPYGEAGSRLYRTGDRVRYQADGQLQYLGRLDQQVKVRGLRIELGEVESALLSHPQVRQAVVLAPEGEGGQRQLVGYVVGGGEAVTSGQLREHLLRTLPEYMVPGLFVQLASMPLTAHGKVDRRALPAPDPIAQLQQQYVAPRTPTEQALASIWGEVLRLEKVGTQHNFFDVGGDSLLLARVRALVLDRLGRAPELVDFLTYPTIRALAARLDGNSGSNELLQEAAARGQEHLREARSRGRRRKALRNQKEA